MIKFMVVLSRKKDIMAEEFAANLRTIHGPMAERIPGLRRYVRTTSSRTLFRFDSKTKVAAGPTRCFAQ